MRLRPIKPLLRAQGVAGQAVRYGMVGGVVYLADLAAFLLCFTLMNLDVLAANAVGRIAGALTGLVLHDRFTFTGPKGRSGISRALRYGALLLTNILVSSALIGAVTRLADLPQVAVRIGVDVVVIVASFFISRSLIFSSRPQGRTGD